MRVAIYQKQLKNGTGVVATLIAEIEEERELFLKCMPGVLSKTGNKLIYQRAETGNHHAIRQVRDVWLMQVVLRSNPDTSPITRTEVQYEFDADQARLVMSLPDRLKAPVPHVLSKSMAGREIDRPDITFDDAVHAVNWHLGQDKALEAVVEDRMVVIYRNTRRRVI